MVGNSLKKYQLLLVGKTGNGKSSTGNTILGRPVFHTRAACVVNRDDVMNYATVRDEERNRLVHVVDGTGIGDVGNDARLNKETLAARLNENLWSHVTDLTAVILVMKFGVRYTKQEREQVKAVKGLLGDDVMRRWGVIVMTQGDNFETDNIPFETWCRDRRGSLRRLLEECDYRCVLFNNQDRSQGPVDRLFVLVDQIQRPYPQKYFHIGVEEGGLYGEKDYMLRGQADATRHETSSCLNVRRHARLIGYWLLNICCFRPRRVGDERSLGKSDYVEMSLVYSQKKRGR